MRFRKDFDELSELGTSKQITALVRDDDVHNAFFQLGKNHDGYYIIGFTKPGTDDSPLPRHAFVSPTTMVIVLHITKARNIIGLWPIDGLETYNKIQAHLPPFLVTHVDGFVQAVFSSPS